jgi:hypothetical protein
MDLRSETMTGANKVACLAAALLVMFTFSSMPAKAQFAGLGGGGDMMTQMAPMLNMMKAKMGKRRFAALMQTMGPMMGQMMGADGGGGGGGIPNGLGGMLGGDGIPGGFGSGGDVMGTLGGSDGGGMMSMLPQLMQLANLGGGHRRYRHHRRR